MQYAQLCNNTINCSTYTNCSESYLIARRRIIRGSTPSIRKRERKPKIITTEIFEYRPMKMNFIIKRVKMLQTFPCQFEIYASWWQVCILFPMMRSLMTVKYSSKNVSAEKQRQKLILAATIKNIKEFN